MTGLRRGELVKLKWDQVDLSRRVIRVVSSSTFRTKAGRARNVPLSDIGHAVLVARAERPGGEYVFSRGGRPLYAAGLSRELKLYVRLLGLDERLHFHSLRHSFASWLAQANVSIYTLKELLGHADVKTTQVYAHLQPDGLQEIVNRIELKMN